MSLHASRRVVCAAFLLCVFAVSAAASETHRVVLLYDERLDLPGLALLDASLVHSLTSGPAGSVEVYREAMDLSRFNSDSYLPRLRDHLRAKYAAKKIDVVVAAMGPALDFLLSPGDPVFPGTPIVFCGIDRREIERRALPRHVTGVLLKRAFAPTLDVALRLHPDTRHVVFVGGTSEFDVRLVEQARSEFRSHEERLAFRYLTTLPVRDLLAELGRLPPHTIVLYSTVFRDGAGEAFVPHEVAERVSAAANAPVYGFVDQYLGRGIVGGQVYSLDLHAQQAADLVRQILGGKPPSDLPWREGAATLALFDWRQLQRWGISESRLPAGSTIRYKQPGAWELYGFEIIGAILLVLVQTGLIAALLLQRRRHVRDQRALRESEERFRLMADSAPVMVWTAGVDKLCDFFNRSWLDFTGRTLEHELGNGWTDGVFPDDRDRCLRTYVSAFDARAPFQMEYRLRRADGVYRWILDIGVPRSGPDGAFAGYIGSSIDITDRKEAVDALNESQQRYAVATAAGGVGVWDWNFETNDVYVDPTVQSILGIESGGPKTRADDWASRVHPEDLAAVTARAQACMDGSIDEYEVEHRMIHEDGSVRWFLSRGSLVRRADGTPYRMVGTKVDITDRKRAEDAIREKEAVLRFTNQRIQDLAGRLIASQEVERARIARELHDDLSQQVAALSIALSGLRRRVAAWPDGGDLRGEVASLQQRTISLAENVRQISHDLHPSVLEHAGLVPALAEHCAALARRQSAVVSFTAEGDFTATTPDVALCLYRVAQEALRNVVTHAGPCRTEVRLRRSGPLAELTIVDHGVGFDIVQTTKNGKGLGLVSISERVRLAGGSVSFVTELNKGTRVSVGIPADRRATTRAAAVPVSYGTPS